MPSKISAISSKVLPSFGRRKSLTIYTEFCCVWIGIPIAMDLDTYHERFLSALHRLRRGEDFNMSTQPLIGAAEFYLVIKVDVPLKLCQDREQGRRAAIKWLEVRVISNDRLPEKPEQHQEENKPSKLQKPQKEAPEKPPKEDKSSKLQKEKKD